MNDFVGWCRQLRQGTRRWGERVLLASTSSTRTSEVEEVESVAIVALQTQGCPPPNADHRGGSEFESEECPSLLGMDHGRQGSKRSSTCLDTRVKDVVDSAHKSEQSTRENIVADVEGEYLEAEQLTTAMSKEAQREPQERGGGSKDGGELSSHQSLLTEGSRSTYSKSSTFPRSKTELLDGSQRAASVSGVVVACPPHGAKSVMGRRAKMEDTFVAIPDLIGVAFADSLNEIIPPRIADQLQQLSENDSCSTAKQSGSSGLATAAIGGEDGMDKPKADSDTIVYSTSSKSLGAKLRSELDVQASTDKEGGEKPRGPEARRGRPRKLFEQIHFFGVFDGHGGADAAHHCQETMHERLKEAIIASCPRATMERAAAMERGLDSLDDKTFSELEASICSSEAFSKALAQAFKVTDEEFAKLSGEEDDLALVGTTAVVTLLSSQSIYVANAGDSRAVLLRNGTAMALTDDHKAAREDETARVEAAGGQILFWNGVRVMGLLAVSRAIGDHSLRPYVIADPEVTVMNRHPSDELLVMASDGLWDVITNQEACSLAKKCLLRARQKGSTRENAARVAATVLTRAAVDRGSRDNVTVLVIDLMQDLDDQIDQDALKMCMSEDLRTVRTDRGIDEEDDQVIEGLSADTSSIGDDRPEKAAHDVGVSSFSGHGRPMAGPPPTPFMGTPFDHPSAEDVGDGIDIPCDSCPDIKEPIAEFEMVKSQSYRSPFETLGFYPSGSQEYE